MEFYHILREIWRCNKLEFFAWLFVAVYLIPFVFVPLVHDKIEAIQPMLSIPIRIKGLSLALGHILLGFLGETFLLMLISRSHMLYELIKCRSIGKDDIKRSIKNLTYHLTDRSTVCNVYGNTLVSKLEGPHKPRDPKDTADSFWFIRRDFDFESPSSVTTPSSFNLISSGQTLNTTAYGDINTMRDKLRHIQMDDFYTIQQCIKKTWDTVAYGDISALLQKPEYLAHNVKILYGYSALFFKRFEKIPYLLRVMIKKRPWIKVRRLFIYPYVTGNNIDGLIEELKTLVINNSILKEIIIQDPSTGCPRINGNLRTLFPSISDNVLRAICDIVFLIWLIKIHEYFGIDYRILSRRATNNSSSIDIVDINLLNSWKDEGSALIDGQIVVRFDDKMDTGGVIYYQFIKGPREKLDGYKSAFDTIWSDSIPNSYTFLKKNHSGPNPPSNLLFACKINRLSLKYFHQIGES